MSLPDIFFSAKTVKLTLNKGKIRNGIKLVQARRLRALTQ